ncbi:MAG: response regulator [Anaerolineae bacterium]|nr:response regulator [Anaerolineae bacterium]
MKEILRALIVDDEKRIRLFLAETLQRESHIVTTATSGHEALEYLQDTPFDLAILDLMLGGRIDGQRVLEAIRWRWPAKVCYLPAG